ncbi:MAG: hypothetical protein KUG76_00900 [Gammaproteobacteria bacterium]|nr:hypothetical protein [Gammaproteobacteria bacterium]
MSKNHNVLTVIFVWQHQIGHDRRLKQQCLQLTPEVKAAKHIKKNNALTSLSFEPDTWKTRRYYWPH